MGWNSILAHPDENPADLKDIMTRPPISKSAHEAMKKAHTRNRRRIEDAKEEAGLDGGIAPQTKI